MLEFATARRPRVQCAHALLRYEGAAAPVRVGLGCVSVTDYRLDDLSRISGVSARNIRAYRERGLLDPPRKVGRSAYYNDGHIAQLQTINQLLRKGFNSVHIAEFFAGMRQGADLADVLGLQDAGLRPRRGGQPSSGAGPVVDVDPTSPEAHRLVSLGLAEYRDRGVAFIDPELADIVARAADPLGCVRMIISIGDVARGSADALSAAVIDVLENGIGSRFGPAHRLAPGEIPEFSQTVQGFRDLATKVVVGQLESALRQQLVTTVSAYTGDVDRDPGRNGES